MTINCEQIHTLKADADKSADNFKPTMVVDTKLIRCLLADRDADKALIAEQAKRIAELQGGQKKLIGWRVSDYTDETSDPELAKNWAAAIGVLPIFEGDVNTKLEARALLAAREQEPVAYMCDGDDGREYNGHNEFSCGSRGIPLYAHPALASDAESLRIADALESLLWPNMALGNKAVIQAAIDALRTHPAPVPAVPDEVPEWLKDKLVTICDMVEDNDEYCQDIWNACRTAMQPNVTLTYEGDNHTEHNLGMVNHIGEDTGTDEVKPVTAATVPAGYVLVPVEPTDLMVEAMYRNQLSMRGALKAAIAAAPAVSDGWIPVSERMPDKVGLYLCWGTYFDGAEPDYIPVSFFIHPTNGWSKWEPFEDDCDPNYVTITHWQPLPDAPKVTP